MVITLKFDSIRYQDQMCTMVSVIDSSMKHELAQAQSEKEVSQQAKQIVETNLLEHGDQIVECTKKLETRVFEQENRRVVQQIFSMTR
jgi:hypothetical protein